MGFGGLGIRSTALLAPSAFLATAAGYSSIMRLCHSRRLVDALTLGKSNTTTLPLQPLHLPIKKPGMFHR